MSDVPIYVSYNQRRVDVTVDIDDCGRTLSIEDARKLTGLLSDILAIHDGGCQARAKGLDLLCELPRDHAGEHLYQGVDWRQR